MSTKAVTGTYNNQHRESPDIPRQEQLDHELEGTFPASDPPSLTQPVRPGAPDRQPSGGKPSAFPANRM